MSTYDADNVFAKILRKELPCHKIFETDHCLAILDAFPVTRGHALLIPKEAATDCSELSPAAAAAALQELPRLCRAVKLATGAPAVHVAANCGKEAGQVVMHTHFHVIPTTGGLIQFPKPGKLEDPEGVIAAMQKHL